MSFHACVMHVSTDLLKDKQLLLNTSFNFTVSNKTQIYGVFETNEAGNISWHAHSLPFLALCCRYTNLERYLQQSVQEISQTFQYIFIYCFGTHMSNFHPLLRGPRRG